MPGVLLRRRLDREDLTFGFHGKTGTVLASPWLPARLLEADLEETPPLLALG